MRDEWKVFKFFGRMSADVNLIKRWKIEKLTQRLFSILKRIIFISIYLSKSSQSFSRIICANLLTLLSVSIISTPQCLSVRLHKLFLSFYSKTLEHERIIQIENLLAHVEIHIADARFLKDILACLISFRFPLDFIFIRWIKWFFSWC